MQERPIFAIKTTARNLPVLDVWTGIIIAAPKNPADKLINKSENNIGRTTPKLFMNKLYYYPADLCA